MVSLSAAALFVGLSRAGNVTVGVTDKRLAWSGPEQYNPDCSVAPLMKDETVSLNFTGTSIIINFVSSNISTGARISIDGAYITTVDTYESHSPVCHLLPWLSRNLSQVQHNITVTGGDRIRPCNASRPSVFINSFVYAPAELSSVPGSSSIPESTSNPGSTSTPGSASTQGSASSTSVHGSSKVAPIIGGTIGGVIGLLLILAILFLLFCRRRRLRNRVNSDLATEKLNTDPATSSQLGLVRAASGAYHEVSQVFSGNISRPSASSSPLSQREPIIVSLLTAANAPTNKQTKAQPHATESPSKHGDMEFINVDTALVPASTVEKLNDWTAASKVVFCIDIGTSHSAISFAYLQSQKDPVIENVSAWPGQSDDPTRTTTVTAIYYDENNTPRSYGTATRMYEIKERARAEGWLLVDSFKRHINDLSDVVLTERFLQTDVHKLVLPDNVPIGTVYADWMKYLFGHAVSIFTAKYTKEVWDKLKDDIEVVFTVPNGWYTQEHGVLVNAALKAKIIQKPAQANFVAETEAAIHWALMSSGLSPDENTNFLVCNAGASTTDIALYHVSKSSPLQLQERKDFPSQCIEAGSALIADAFLNDLAGKMLADDDLDVLRQGATDAIYHFGAPNATGMPPNDKGALAVSQGLAPHFNREIAKIITGINKMKADNIPKFLLLLGDFGCSPYFQGKLRERYEPDMQIISVGENATMSTAPGSIISFLQNVVDARAARFSFGTGICVEYKHDDPEQRGRTVHLQPDGDFVWHGWDQIVSIGTLVANKQEHKRSYYIAYATQNESLADFETDIYTAGEGVESTRWLNDCDGKILPGFHKRCKVHADMSKLQGKLPDRLGPRGRYYHLDFEVAIKFGTISPEARLVWIEDGKEVSGEATVVPVTWT